MLLKMRLPKILVLHGLEIKSDDDYAKDIIHVMEHARKLFNCSFTAITERVVKVDVNKFVKKDVKVDVGGDVLTDLKNKYVNCGENEKPPRKYEFKVQYSDGST